ncbi:MAG TPA: TetR/AcrR family transcriptional regulator [Perlabentimonas sp.]|nr:TetR/AcrR family transcriptional regulator [Perlabentimonas sp.]
MKKTKQKILVAATELFLDKGIDRVGVREIATKAEVNLSLMNYYFQSKENLLFIIFDMLVKDGALQTREILESNAPIEQKINDYAIAYIDLLIEKPVLVSFVISVIHRNPEKIKTMDSAMGLYNSEIFCEQLKTEAQAGRIKPVDPEQLFISLISLILFPFTIRDLIMDKNSFSSKDYVKFMEERKTHVSSMIYSFLKI